MCKIRSREEIRGRMRNALKLNIGWLILERQLQAWSRLLRARKTLRIQMSFNSVETARSPNKMTRQGTKQVFSSVFEQMLSE